MNNLSYYLIQANTALAACYLLLRLCGTDTFLKLRRTLLLAVSVFALLCPLLPGWLPAETGTGAPQAGIATLALPMLTVETVRQTVLSLPEALAAAYLLVAAVLAVRLAMQTLGLLRFVRRLPVMEAEGRRCRLLPGGHEAFSFLGYLCLPEDALRSPHLRELIRHEEAHIRQRHTLDVLWSRLLCALCWPNPAAWLLMRELRTLHEYLADAAALAGPTPRRDYQMALLSLSFPLAAANITNKFNVLSIKKRIAMMNKKPTSGLWQAKYLLLLPVTTLLVALNPSANAATGSALSAGLSSQDPAALQTLPATLQQEEPHQVADHMPEYPGGTPALMSHICSNIKYPAKAMGNKVEGTVVVQFVVDKEGKVTNVKVTRSLSPECDAEALRVVKTLKKFKPGRMKDGRIVPVYFTVPIRFAIK